MRSSTASEIYSNGEVMSKTTWKCISIPCTGGCVLETNDHPSGVKPAKCVIGGGDAHWVKREFSLK